MVVPKCEVFPTDSPVRIYKSVTGELLRVVLEGIILALCHENMNILFRAHISNHVV